MIYKTKQSKLYSKIAFLFSFIIYILSLILTYKFVVYVLNPFVDPIVLFFSFILMVINFNQENFTISPPKFILRQTEEGQESYKFDLTAYSGDKDDVNIYIEYIELEVSSSLKVFEVYRGNNKLDCEEVQSDAKRRKYTKCLVKDQADVNTRFLVKILPNSAKPEDVNRLEIRLFYVKRFWLMKVNYLESHTVKSG